MASALEEIKGFIEEEEKIKQLVEKNQLGKTGELTRDLLQAFNKKELLRKKYAIETHTCMEMIEIVKFRLYNEKWCIDTLKKSFNDFKKAAEDFEKAEEEYKKIYNELLELSSKE